jgi:hypothetical protein
VFAENEKPLAVIADVVSRILKEEVDNRGLESAAVMLLRNLEGDAGEGMNSISEKQILG